MPGSRKISRHHGYEVLLVIVLIVLVFLFLFVIL